MSRGIARGSGLIHDAVKAMTGGITEDEVRALRHKLGVRPVFKRIDTCAAEFEAKTPYMYSTYEAPSFGEPEDESAADRPAQDRHPRRRAEPDRAGDRVRLLLLPRLLRAGGCRASRRSWSTATRRRCRTDYDTSDRLYFEPLTAEDVLEILACRAVRTASWSA